MRAILRLLLSLAAPFTLIGAGALLLGAVSSGDWPELLLYAGFALIGAGIVWGLFLYMAVASGSFFD